MAPKLHRLKAAHTQRVKFIRDILFLSIDEGQPHFVRAVSGFDSGAVLAEVIGWSSKFMKTFIIAMLGLTATTVWAQTNPSAATATNKVEVIAPIESAATIRTLQALEQNKPAPPKPNEIRTETGVYSGVLPQLAKSENPLQMINPAASKEYGDAKDNTSFDPNTGQAQGIKLFSFSWFNSNPNKPRVKKVKTTASAKGQKTK
jgi:hypothetical protein